MIHIEQIAPHLTWPIRYQVMYPEHDLDFVKIENDDEGIHFGLYYNQKLTGIVSVFNEGKIKPKKALEQGAKKDNHMNEKHLISDFIKNIK